MSATALTKKDFVNDQEVRWCPGCGDYAILAAIQKTMPELGVAREKIVFVSGIGCSSRFPYYMNTYGFHTIHGRAPTIATGLALARPDLSIWVITGDGDALSIGGNHLIHAMRRNVNIKVLLFNNQTYGLTKGQYSPTSHPGTISKSTPYGSVDQPFSATAVALGAGATFVARTYDKDARHMSDVFKRAHEHKGAAFVEILQNCVIFNDGVFEDIVGKDQRVDHMLHLQHGERLRFGKDNQKGLAITDFAAEVVDAASGRLDDVAVHREDLQNPGYAFLLSHLMQPEFPEPVGVFRSVEKPGYESAVIAQIEEQTARRGRGNLDALLRSGDTWQIH
ncbi:MAG: 2-oxoacid:ferredoxin oxidoreductase subunit beta [Leptospirales bacterium]|nr:2-oxoacid:ferredoxin oxidoreductase subunit beta [Leptospirales bacterium]